jgi:osmotically-inducible protein OsmY
LLKSNFAGDWKTGTALPATSNKEYRVPQNYMSRRKDSHWILNGVLMSFCSILITASGHLCGDITKMHGRPVDDADISKALDRRFAKRQIKGHDMRHIQDKLMNHIARPSAPVLAAILIVACLGLSGCAGALFGVGTAAVAASTTEKGISTSVSDGVILTKLHDKFIQNDASLSTAVDVAVNDGAVLMTGKVKTPEEKILATKLAWEIKGVREVVNELQVTDQSSIKDIAKDLAASAQLRGKLIADPDISSLNYSIDVVNGVVYLSGVATDTDEMNKVVTHAQELRFAQQVVNYIILATDKRD